MQKSHKYKSLDKRKIWGHKKKLEKIKWEKFASRKGYILKLRDTCLEKIKGYMLREKLMSGSKKHRMDIIDFLILLKNMVVIF